MPPKEEPSFPPPFECQMEQRGTGGCCGGSEWVNVTAHLDVAPDGQTLTLVIKGHHEDVEQGEKDYVVTHVDAFDDRRKYISLTGNFDNNETTCRFMKSDVQLKKWAANYKRFSRLKADRARVQNATKKTDYDTFNNSAGNTTSTEVNPIPEDPALSDPTVTLVTSPSPCPRPSPTFAAEVAASCPSPHDMLLIGWCYTVAGYHVGRDHLRSRQR